MASCRYHDNERSNASMALVGVSDLSLFFSSLNGFTGRW